MLIKTIIFICLAIFLLRFGQFGKKYRFFSINQDVVTVEDHDQLKISSIKRERIKEIRNHRSMNSTLIISVLNAMIGG